MEDYILIGIVSWTTEELLTDRHKMKHILILVYASILHIPDNQNGDEKKKEDVRRNSVWVSFNGIENWGNV